MSIFDLGWSPHWDRYIDSRQRTAVVRVIAQHKTLYRGCTLAGQQLNCHMSGKMRYQADGDGQLPAVGDWCLVGALFKDVENQAAAVIERILPRRSQLSRCAVGSSQEQVLAANVDIVFIVTSINRDFSINRLRRYLLLAESGGCLPIVVLSKCDLGGDLAELVEMRQTMPQVQVIETSALEGFGVEQIDALLTAGVSGVFVGSSGVGKSTLLNTLLKARVQATAAVRSCDDSGRHATSGSSLFLTEAGGIIIDTAGLREVGLLVHSDQMEAAMPTVTRLAAGCRFSDCSHGGEPGCAVLSALANGQLAESEFVAYGKLEREAAFNERRQNKRLADAERKRWKRIEMDNRRDMRRR